MSHLHGSGLALRTSIPETGIRVPVSASAKGAVLGAPCRPRCRLPGSPCLAPSSTSLLRHPRWLVAGCIPPLNVTEFEQRVLYRRGPAQVGFGVSLSSFHRLTLSSGGILSPEPLRLTRPERASQRHLLVSPFQGSVAGRGSGPRALPWAVMFGPFGANSKTAQHQNPPASGPVPARRDSPLAGASG